MNLFVTSPFPRICAVNLDDKRLGKQLIEANQLLSTAIYLRDPQIAIPCIKPDQLSEPTHKKHPVTQWVFRSYNNFNWVRRFAFQLSAEWYERFHKTHGSAYRTAYITDNIDRLSKAYPDQYCDGITVFHNQAMNKSLNLDFSDEPDTFLAYQKYLRQRWKTDTKEPAWTNRQRPSWA